MKIDYWNIEGCNHLRNIRTLARKIKQEKPDILFLQETKCSFETMIKIGKKIWKGSKVMATDVDGMKGGMAILWHPREVDPSEWRAGHFSLIAEFQIIGSEIRGTKLISTTQVPFLRSRILFTTCDGYVRRPRKDTRL